MNLSANQIQEEESSARGDYYALALFREEANGDVSGLEFQRGVGGIYGDGRAGSPPYCVVTADHRTYYGGVRTVTWRDSSVEVDLTDEAREVLRLPARVVLELQLGAEDIGRVRNGLLRVFHADDPEMLQPNLVGFD
ncbi:hypothetical protein GCM10023322_06460 [Rugosimonospora acidiphila]|uniref:Uncharacterized protein n=1 Tax=Rugosimonospora acidiphila TaxID=556531 RepID=A0ABP9RK82_9ACTN